MAGSGQWHEPVLVAEVVRFLAPAPAALIVDATVGTGGHAEALLARGARVIGIDQDPAALDRARERLRPYTDRVQLLPGNFRDLPALVPPVPRVDGVLFDLGASSLQFDSPERGFSFLAAGPLDMRMDPTAPVTAADLVNRLPEAELARILWEYGEERYARRIARAIVQQRPLRTTTELARLVACLYPPGRHRIHPATRTFQALRIAVNDELGALEAGLAGAVRLLAPGGVLCVISFHSLEDRIVKHFLRREALTGRLEVLTKKPLRPEEDEVSRNPRARSAKLRAARVREVGPGLVSCP
ncbi:MAG TPA: 16S rRNA (cytosine(1402)-N(4))-methyltransferase RsmH [Candidatus Bipolaricaulis anaerobius]|nr:16S rRNA (cytosine(1402)-N(4))-methyltransferase RsmH [Candidatus Bipolaricaulis anaerobius]